MSEEYEAMRIKAITEAVGQSFRCFGGGGKPSVVNPVTMAMADAPRQFAAGVDVAQVVNFIITAFLCTQFSSEYKAQDAAPRSSKESEG